MQSAVFALTNTDYKGKPKGEVDVTMEFVKALPDPQLSLFRFTFEPPQQAAFSFNLVCRDAVLFFRLLANIMAASPVLPGNATIFDTVDDDGSFNGSVGIKADLGSYVDTLGNPRNYYSYSFLPDSGSEGWFVLGRIDAGVFYYAFDCLLASNPPNPPTARRRRPSASRKRRKK